MNTHESYLVVEPGLTPLRPGQWLSEDELDAVDAVFGSAALAVVSDGDLVDAGLVALTSRAGLSDRAAPCLTRLATFRGGAAPEALRRSERRMLFDCVLRAGRQVSPNPTAANP